MKIICEIPVPDGLFYDYFPTPMGLLFQFENYFKDGNTLSLALMNVRDILGNAIEP
jgi:hypothetical protein